MKKDPIIILGSSLNPREAAHPQCHKCLCYRCKPTNRQRERSALQDFLYSGGMRAEFPSPTYVEPCVSVTVPGVVSGSPCSYLFTSISPLYPSPVSLALSPPQAFVSFPCGSATSKHQGYGMGRAIWWPLLGFGCAHRSLSAGRLLPCSPPHTH